jgi:hypothetical protein
VEVERVLHDQFSKRIKEFLGWKDLTLQMPHATVHSSLVADAWFA